ncbi:MAG: MFS transporter [Candidatus Bathyarchaeia archaeon]
MACLIYAFTGMNVMLIAATLPAIIGEWNLNLVVAGTLASSGYLGMFVGALSCGFLADLFGRKKAILLTLVMMATFTGLCSISWDVVSMSVLRFLAGIGLGGSLPQPGVYISEYVPAKNRGTFLGMTESSWVYGALLAILFPFFLLPTYGWRLTFLVAFIPLFLVPLVKFLMPESLRYLELKGRQEEAMEMLHNYGLIPSGKISSKDDPKTTKVTAKPSLLELWSPSYRGRTALLWISWAVLVYTYHGIFVWLPKIYQGMGLTLVRSLFWVVVVTLVQVPGYYSATFLLDRIGRKRVLGLYLAVAGVACFLLGFSRDIGFILLWSSVISFFNLGAWAGLYTYTPELYPTRMRGTGSGTAASIGRLAGIIAPTLTPLLWVTWGLWSAFGVFAFAHIAAALAVTLLGVETKWKALEEISE